MPDALLTRKTRNVEATVGTSVSSSTTVSFADVAAGVIHVSGLTATAVVTVMGSADGKTFVELFTSAGEAVAVTLPADGGVVALPDAAFALRSLRLVSVADLGTGATVVVSVKS